MIKRNTIMKPAQTLCSLFLSGAFALGAVACGDDGDSNSDVDATVSDDDASVAFVCDPVGAVPAVGTLLNASLDTDVDVIVKEAQHPGNPGPLNLP